MQHSIADPTNTALRPARPVPAGRAPRVVTWTAGMAIASLVGGAIYLIAVRGDALLLDLSALSKYVFCF
jgi:hypothetical protein